jgi:hypothetical protein
VNVTRSHSGSDQVCICQPESGVADTSDADFAPTEKTARPPVIS